MVDDVQIVMVDHRSFDRTVLLSVPFVDTIAVCAASDECVADLEFAELLV